MNEQKRMNILLAFLFAMLIVAVFLIIADPTKKPNQFVYNGFVITRFRLPSAPDVVFHSVDLFVSNKQYNIPLRNNPQDLESIRVSGLDAVSWLSLIKESDNYDVKADRVYITFNPTKLIGADVIIAGGEIVRVLGSGQGGIYKKQVSAAFTQQLNGSSTQIKDCQDASSDTGIIRLELGEDNRVYAEGDCVIIEGQTYSDLIRSSDRFLLALLGVINI